MIISWIAISSPVIAMGEECDSTFRMLDEMVVTATRTPRAIKDVPVITRVIGAEEIKKSNALNIKDLLIDELPGLEFSYAMNQETTLNIGGFGGNGILFLVDGERMAGETLDNIDYERLNLENVGRVEIIKGAASALYGANAVGGVINLISKENTDPWRVDLHTRYRAEGNAWEAGGNINFNFKRWNFNTSIQYNEEATINLTSPFDTASKIHNIYGGQVLDVKEKIIFRSAEGAALTGRIGYFYRNSNRDTYLDTYHDYSAGLKFSKNNLEISYSYDQYDKARLIDGINTHNHDYSNRQHIVHGFYNKSIGKVILSVGADYMFDFLASYQFKDKESRSQSVGDAFVEVEYNPINKLMLTASVRDDYYSASKSNAVTGRFAAMLRLKPGTLRCSYAGGFRAPTLKEMYMDFDMAGIATIYGNPDLKPERNHNFNISIERGGQIFGGAYSVAASGYFNYYENRIAVSEIDINGRNEEGARYYNEKDVKIAGCDLTSRYRAGFGVGVSVSLNFAHFSGMTVNDQFSPPRPFSATWKIDYQHTFNARYKTYASIGGRYLGKPDCDYDAQGAYSMLKLIVTQSIGRGIDFNLTVDNLLNYKPKIYYWDSPPTSGISWSIGVSINLNELYKSI